MKTSWCVWGCSHWDTSDQMSFKTTTWRCFFFISLAKTRCQVIYDCWDYKGAIRFKSGWAQDQNLVWARRQCLSKVSEVFVLPSDTYVESQARASTVVSWSSVCLEAGRLMDQSLAGSHQRLFGIQYSGFGIRRFDLLSLGRSWGKLVVENFWSFWKLESLRLLKKVKKKKFIQVKTQHFCARL